MSEQQAVTSLAPVVGRWEIPAADKAIYLASAQNRFGRPFGICVSNIRLVEGEARVKIQFKSGPTDGAGRILLGYRSLDDDYISVGLGGYGAAYVISHFSAARGWRAIAIAGDEENLRPEQLYEISVTVEGQRISLDVDGVRVLGHVLENSLPQGQLGLFAWGNQNVEFESLSAKAQAGTIFVIMQLSSGPYQELYSDVIQPAATKFGFRASHAGDVFGPGAILEDIVRGIVEAKIVIAEITPPNQNVFYELGFAHALKKPTILLAERGKQLPFDVSGYRVLFYENSIGGKRQVVEGLCKHLEAIREER